MTKPPTYVSGHRLLEGKTVLVTAAAGTGIGFATAVRCAEEGASGLVISDIHERRLGEAAEKIEAETGVCPDTGMCNVRKSTCGTISSRDMLSMPQSAAILLDT